MAKPTPNDVVFPLSDGFSKQWDGMANKLSPLIKKKLNSGMSPQEATKEAFKELGIKRRVSEALADGIIAAVQEGGALTIVDTIGFRKWYLHKHFNDSPINLSQKIATLESRQIVSDTLFTQMKQGRMLRQAAKSMTDQKLIKADVSSTITELTKRARKVATGDTTSFAAYKSTLKKAQKELDRLTSAGEPLTRLHKAYQSVIDASTALDEKMLDKSVDRAVRAKARYNAERIARTEYARAYGVGEKTRAQEDNDVVGLRWNLSTRHAIFDICDMNANADLFGIGKGVYPKDSLPQYPAHPHCMCNLEQVFDVPGEAKFQERGATSYLDDLSESNQKKLMGVNGAEAYNANKKVWKQKVKQFGVDDGAVVPDKYIAPITVEPAEWGVVHAKGMRHGSVIDSTDKKWRYNPNSYALENLPEEEMKSLRSWKGSGYKTIRSAQKGFDKFKDDYLSYWDDAPEEEILKSFESAKVRAKIMDDKIKSFKKYKGTSYRGINVPKKDFDGYIKMNPGEEIFYDSLTSESKSYNVAHQFASGMINNTTKHDNGIIFVIKHNGKKSAAIWEGGTESEFEVLSRRTSRFRITKKYKTYKDDTSKNFVVEMLHIEMEEI